ncbi:MAG TPA: YdcF family protein, partial [Cytophaga sp.]|nr:YdcF family protein [Cytophaga sp.]
SGGAVYSPYKEAEIMAMYAIQLGIPAEHIFIEIQAEHSTENLYYSYKIAQQNGFKRVAVATDATQSSFMYSANNHRFKIPVDFIPIVYDTLKQLPRVKPDIDQDAALVPDFVSIIDRESLWKRLRGTRGRKVDKLMREDLKNSKQ